MAQHFRWHKTPSTVSGAWSGVPTEDLASAYKMRPCYLSQILVRSSTSDTEFNVFITDDKGFDIRRFITVTGVTNDLTLTPIVGDITVSIDSATRDEAFQVLIVFTLE